MDAPRIDGTWALLAHQRARLITLARRYGLSTPEAEDQVSEAFITVVTYPHLNHDRAVQLAVTVVRRGCVDELRRQQRSAKASRRLLAPPVGSPEDAVCSRDSARAMLGLAAAQLSRQELGVVCLAADGEPHDVIAARLGISARASELTLSRARAKLRRQLSYLRVPRRQGAGSAR